MKTEAELVSVSDKAISMWSQASCQNRYNYVDLYTCSAPLLGSGRLRVAVIVDTCCA